MGFMGSLSWGPRFARAPYKPDGGKPSCRIRYGRMRPPPLPPRSDPDGEGGCVCLWRWGKYEQERRGRVDEAAERGKGRFGRVGQEDVSSSRFPPISTGVTKSENISLERFTLKLGRTLPRNHRLLCVFRKTTLHVNSRSIQ